jgi:hypothetical protein
MDGDLNWLWIMLAIFVFMSMAKGGRLSGQQRRMQDKLADLQRAQSTPPPALPGPSREEVARLEERVRVLERIVTDRRYDLASEIEALRTAEIEEKI